MRRFFPHLVFFTLTFFAVGVFLMGHPPRALGKIVSGGKPRIRTVPDVIQRYGDGATARLVPAFSRAGVAYPPRKVALLGLKQERLVELWAFGGEGWQFIKKYPIRAESGTLGPKLREGDLQIPEGIYRITWLNPNSNFHLSMKLNYPNAFDLRQARREGRREPGSNIFIHGKSVSIGCLAMGDEAIEDLFVLVARVGKENVRVLIAPHDPRTSPLPRSLPNAPIWLPELYLQIESAFGAFARD